MHLKVEKRVWGRKCTILTKSDQFLRTWGGRFPRSKKSKNSPVYYLAHGSTMVQLDSLKSKNRFLWDTLQGGLSANLVK